MGRRDECGRQEMVWMSRGGRALAAVSTAVVGVAGLAVASPVAPAAAASCQPAGGPGLRTVLGASSGVPINGTIDATGCDLGIYVPPGSNGITIQNVTVTGANDHGILADGANGLAILDSTVKGNGVKPTDGVTENKGIQLDGVTNV